MNAVVLSGGLGERLRPLTNILPKTMVEINHKPLLWYHINHLKQHGIDNIWIALHWLPEIVIDFFEDGSKYGVKINYSVEEKSLGTSGALRNPKSEIEKHLKEDRFLVVYGDNLTDFDHTALIKFHSSKKLLLTIGLYESKEPWTGGVIETFKNGRIKSAVEKPPKEKVSTNTISAGIMVCEPEVINYIPDGASDFGFDIIPKLLKLGKPLYALNTGSYVQDCGTLERLKKANEDFREKKIKFNF